MAKRKKKDAAPPVSKPSKDEMDMLKCSSWQNRIKKAEDTQKEWLGVGREIKTFVEGDQWNPADDMGTPDNDWMKTTNNRLWPLFQGYLSNLVYQRPNVTAKPVRSGDEAVQRAKVNSLLMNYTLREGRYAEHTRLAVSDALLYGAGAKEQRVDPHRGDICVSRWVNIEDILVDPQANTTIDSVAWVGKRYTMSLSKAKRLFKKSLRPGYDLTADKHKDDKKKSSVGKTSERVGTAEEMDEIVTLYRIYLRGDDPVIDDGDPDDPDNKTTLEPTSEKVEGSAEKSALQKHLEESGNKVITLAMGYPYILDERPWPFVLDHDEFPITFFRAHTYPGKFLPHSPFKPLLPLQKNLNWAMTFMITQMRTMSQTKFVVDQSMFQGNEEEIEKLTSLDDREVIRTNGRFKDALERIDFGTLSSIPVQMYPFMQGAFDDISGFQELFGGMRGARSATEASIREERAQTNSALMLQAVEGAMLEDCRHMLQIMFSVTPLEKIVEIVGAEEAFTQKDSLTGVEMSSYWDPEMEPRTIRSEVDILLEPGSTRRVNREQEVNDRINLMDRKVNLFNMIAGGLAQQVINPDQLQPLLKWVNHDLDQIGDKLGWSDGERPNLPPEVFMLPPEEQPNQSQTFNLKEGDKNVTIQEGDFAPDMPNPSVSIDQPNLDVDMSQNPTTKTGGTSE